MLACNLGIVSEWSAWEGYENIRDKNNLVVHKSLPHGGRDDFIDKDFWKLFDKVVVCTRDLNCCLRSKLVHHQQDRDKAIGEQDKGRGVLSEILATRPDAVIYSYESAFAIGQMYNQRFMESMGVPYSFKADIKEINSKYLC
jgi:hypothetical protein